LEQSTSRVPRGKDEPVLGKRSALKNQIERLEFGLKKKPSSAVKAVTPKMIDN